MLLQGNSEVSNQFGSKMASIWKATTRLTGVPVVNNPHHTLGILYNKILRALEKIPEDAAYRKYTQEIISDKLALVKSEPNPIELEKKMKSGQLEEAIIAAENELLLCRKMQKWKPWEPLLKDPPQNQWKWPM